MNLILVGYVLFFVDVDFDEFDGFVVVFEFVENWVLCFIRVVLVCVEV